MQGSEGCRFFVWIDSDVNERVSKVIRGLLKRLDKHESEIQKLEIEVERKDLEIQKLKLANMKMEVMVKKKMGSIFQFVCTILFGVLLAFLWSNFMNNSGKAQSVLQLS